MSHGDHHGNGRYDNNHRSHDSCAELGVTNLLEVLMAKVTQTMPAITANKPPNMFLSIELNV